MTHYARLSDLPAAPMRAVIINVGTKTVSTLALLSALRHAGMPVLLIDCEYGDDSFAHFTKLMESYDFDLLSAPLQKHGKTLDWLFSNISAEAVLLVDSDVEIVDPEIIRIMKTFIHEPKVFGCGFVHGPRWMHDHPGVGYYQERMWIPLTLLKTSRVREALGIGLSFIDRTILNDFAPSRLISRLLAARFKLSALRDTKLSWLNPFKNTYNGHRPSTVYCDTGADVYQYLKYQRGQEFAGFPAEFHERYAFHFHGATRRTLDSSDLNSLQHGPTDVVPQRLADGYGVRVG
jgi:hypothetical protein